MTPRRSPQAPARYVAKPFSPRHLLATIRKFLPQAAGQGSHARAAAHLVVDDNPANLEILETRLTRQGYEVVTAKDGDEALIAARARTPDLILLDIMMPGKDDVKVCAN